MSTITKHTFTNLNISVYETRDGKGFNWHSENAYLNNRLVSLKLENQQRLRQFLVFLLSIRHIIMIKRGLGQK